MTHLPKEMEQYQASQKYCTVSVLRADAPCFVPSPTLGPFHDSTSNEDFDGEQPSLPSSNGNRSNRNSSLSSRCQPHPTDDTKVPFHYQGQKSKRPSRRKEVPCVGGGTHQAKNVERNRRSRRTIPNMKVGSIADESSTGNGPLTTTESILMNASIKGTNRSCRRHPPHSRHAKVQDRDRSSREGRNKLRRRPFDPSTRMVESSRVVSSCNYQLSTNREDSKPTNTPSGEPSSDAISSTDQREFPDLVLSSVNQHDSSARNPLTQTAKSKSGAPLSSAWSNGNTKSRQIVLSVEPDNGTLEPEFSHSWQGNGLDLLVSSATRTAASSSRRSHQPRNGATASSQPDTKGAVLTSQEPPNVEQTEAPESPLLPRPKRVAMDITKLRDRWWDALHQRNQLMREQDERLRQQQQQPEDPGTFSYHPQVDANRLPAKKSSQDSQSDASSETLSNSSDSLSEPAIDATYLPLEFAVDDGQSLSNLLHKAIRTDDLDTVQALLRLVLHGETARPYLESDALSGAISMAVELHRPSALRILLRERKLPRDGQALLLAAELGNEECLQLLLADTANTWMTQDCRHNTVLHICCQSRHATASTLQLVLDVTSRSSTVLSKLAQSRNSMGQTPLHVACQLGKNDLVEMLLGSLSLAVLSKVLVQLDDAHQAPLLAAITSGSTDVVMSLLMWRGNNHCSALVTKPSLSCCPLKWAVQLRNVDMVVLLLEFNNPLASTSSSRGYDLTNALRAAVMRNKHDQPDQTYSPNEKLELIRVLIEAGGNPCAMEDETSAESALGLAAKQCEADTIRALLCSYDAYLHSIRCQRRRDPMLRKQPESFFAGLESQENAKRSVAMRDALIECLVRGYQQSDDSALSPSYDCCNVLYTAGAQLQENGLARLRALLSSKTLVSLRPSLSLGPVHLFCNYETKCEDMPTLGAPNPTYWSEVMLQLPWMVHGSETECFALGGGGHRHNARGAPHFPDMDVALVCDDGARLVAHSLVLARREGSDKLAAAIRFASMAATSGVTTFEIPVAYASKPVIRMLQHLYHGSLILHSSELDDPTTLAEDLLELLLMAEEFLCPTLMKECEMRLLSADPHRCFCRTCTATLSSDGTTCRTHGSSLFFGQRNGIVLDMLAVAQQLCEAGATGDSADHPYTIDLIRTDQPLSFYSIWPMRGRLTLPPLEALRDAAASALLLHWDTLRDHPEVQSQLRNYGDGHRFLLHSCLESLALGSKSSASSSESEGFQLNSHASSEVDEK